MMAGKKQTTLTPDERLKQALVPTEEQPYEIPENWCWVYGKALFGKMMSQKPTGETFRYIDIDSIDNKNQRVTEPKVTNTADAPSRASRHLQYGDTVFSLVRPYLKNIAFIDETLSDCIGSTGFYVCRPHKAINPFYIYRLMTSPYVVDGLNTFMKGDNSPSIRGENIEDFAYPIPPLAEQKRIVDTIVDLFADLDKAAENAERIVKQHDERRANLLHSAITGELTDTWRQAHGVDINDWTSSTIDDLCYSLKYGTAKKSKKSGPVIVLRMGNMQEGEIDWTDLAYTDDTEDIAKYHLEPGDVLFNRTNSATHVGKTSIYRGEYPAIYAGYLIKLDYDHSRVVGNYLTYALNTPTAREYCQSVKTDGVNQSNINARKIGAFSIPLPSMEEQQEIVRILDELLGKEQRIKEAAEEMLDKIAMMKKSILADAFRGRLATNDPADEPATELLRQILA